MSTNLFIFVAALAAVIQGATMATKHAARLAASFRLSKYTIGFIIIAIISILPETFIAVNASLKGEPAFGLGTLFGSNIADLTLVFTGIIFLAGRGLKIESKILKHYSIYPFFLLLPLALGLDGYFSRLDGAALVITGGLFYFFALKIGISNRQKATNHNGRGKNFVLLLVSMALLLIGSHFTVSSATALAHFLGIKPLLIGMIIVGLGTTMPEFFFSLKAVKKRDDSLAIGDILGTVLADATVVVGILALVRPFAFPLKIIYLTGVFMVAAAFILFRFIHTGRTLSKKEAYFLFAFWLAFVLVELAANA